MTKKSRVLVVGLDGAAPLLLEPWMKSGDLKTLARLAQSGVYTRLSSVMPVLSSAAWSSFMTGMNPGKHGIYDFVRRELGSYRLRVVNREHNSAPSLWRILSDQGHKVVVMNVPMTYPPEEVNGVMVTGLGTPNYKNFTHPASLSSELLDRDYRVNKNLSYKPGQEQNYLNELYDITERQFEAALWLMQESDWDFFMVVFFETDQIAHYFWKHLDPKHPAHLDTENGQFTHAILDFYRRMDAYIHKLVAASGADTNLFVISDHGAGPYYQDVFLNEWLRQHGYLATDLHGPRLKGRHRVFSKFGLTRDNVSLVLRHSGLGRIERWIKDILGDNIEFLPRTHLPEFPHAINWSRTRAYSFGYQGQIYINLLGREPMGIIQPGEEYLRICQEITTRLLDFIDPRDGKPVVDQVLRSDELFSGPQKTFAPDLTLVMRDFTYNTRMGYEFGSKTGAFFSNPAHGESGSHRPEGILFVSGPDIQQLGTVRQGARLIDLAPTILHLLGCTIPSNMDGRVLESWISTNVPPQYSDSSLINSQIERGFGGLTDEEEDEITERLKDLGYLD